MRVSYGRVVCGVLAAVAIAWLASAVDWAAARSALATLGPRAPLIAIPYCFMVACDTIGWRATFERLDGLRLGLLWRMRVATDGVMNSLPGGVALGEALKIVLLK